ncbi:molecular chaperone [Proteus sp. ZN5]|uniref:fimbrial biogenesis chaperone n=1 Tax=Proteus sp. ZN5 TaxID=2697019 RepID=UPI0013E139F6|nr:molecular chaperone [Proteus sp. ZN5]QIG04340.1 fimbria/pilus periplasmic chaperone [Proteus sp. ZN5]
MLSSILSKSLSFFLVTSFLLWSAFSFSEGIGLNKSRLIFGETDKNQTIEITNDNKIPYLVQASILSSLDETISNKFIVTPPLFRVDAESQYTVRIFPNDVGDLPKDKESIFYFKARAIPPSTSAKENTEKTDLVFITAIIVKMYYRPENLPSLDASIFKKINVINEKNIWKINNPTPYFITLVDFSVNHKTQQGSILIAPFKNLEINTENKVLTEASWRFIDDFGGISEKYSFKKEPSEELNKNITSENKTKN